MYQNKPLYWQRQSQGLVPKWCSRNRSILILRFIFQVITAEDGTNSVLVLRMHDTTYLGEYKCSATNPKGQESIVFHVSLGTKPLPPDFVRITDFTI